MDALSLVVLELPRLFFSSWDGFCKITVSRVRFVNLYVVVVVVPLHLSWILLSRRVVA